MRLSPRRQSGRLTKRELRQSLSGTGRKWIKEVWQAAAATSGDLNRLSPVTTPLGNRLVETYGTTHRLPGTEIQRALRIATVAGYASRMVLVEPTEQPTLEPSAFGLKGRPDLERLAGDPTRLIDPTRTVATERFGSVMTLPPEVWNGYVITATMRLQAQLATRTLTWRELGRERIEQMLRYGYVLRCLDEALGAEPELRESDGE
ncbi:MAG: hypothetical protein JO130_03655 [Solirubrobacterales bacterium]|nr:hypothetical protein [Solirubrobacterales bacterium]